jgi:hypothetical protein
MNNDLILGRLLFADGAVRPVFLDDGRHQYVIDLDGHTRVYRQWLRPADDGADAPLTVPAPEAP